VRTLRSPTSLAFRGSTLPRVRTSSRAGVVGLHRYPSRMPASSSDRATAQALWYPRPLSLGPIAGDDELSGTSRPRNVRLRRAYARPQPPLRAYESRGRRRWTTSGEHGSLIRANPSVADFPRHAVNTETGAQAEWGIGSDGPSSGDLADTGSRRWRAHARRQPRSTLSSMAHSLPDLFVEGRRVRRSPTGERRGSARGWPRLRAGRSSRRGRGRARRRRSPRAGRP